MNDLERAEFGRLHSCSASKPIPRRNDGSCCRSERLLFLTKHEKVWLVCEGKTGASTQIKRERYEAAINRHIHVKTDPNVWVKSLLSSERFRSSYFTVLPCIARALSCSILKMQRIMSQNSFVRCNNVNVLPRWNWTTGSLLPAFSGSYDLVQSKQCQSVHTMPVCKQNNICVVVKHRGDLTTIQQMREYPQETLLYWISFSFSASQPVCFERTAHNGNTWESHRLWLSSYSLKKWSGKWAQLTWCWRFLEDTPETVESFASWILISIICN